MKCALSHLTGVVEICQRCSCIHRHIVRASCIRTFDACILCTCVTKLAIMSVKKKIRKEWFYWKGKKVIEKVYYQRFVQQHLGKGLKSASVSNLQSELLDDVNRGTDEEGRRIVRIKTLGEELFCVKCMRVNFITRCLISFRPCQIVSIYSSWRKNLPIFIMNWIFSCV